MYRRRWLIVALCFCVFTGCVSCQGNYDYCGPMPEQGGDFMYRKNSVLGGDPAMKRADEQPAGEPGAATDESGPEPTPAPPPDEEPRPGLEMDDLSPDSDADLTPDADQPGSDEGPQAADESEAEQAGDDGEQVSTLEWHAPSKSDPTAIKQVRFRSE